MILINLILLALCADDIDGLPSSIADVGDLNRDGIADFVVAVRTEKVVIALSGLSGDKLWTIEGFVQALDGTGDIDGDGHGDVVISKGRRDKVVVVVSGKDGQELLRLRNPDSKGAFGADVAGGGDVDGDGLGDIVVGCPSNHLTGAAYVYSGMEGRLMRTLVGEAQRRPSDFGFGTAVEILPDMNGDGICDVAVGDPGWSEDQEKYGRVEIHSLAEGCVFRTPEGVIPGNTACLGLGWSIGSAGMVDSDGIPDIFVSAINKCLRIYSGRDTSIIHEFLFPRDPAASVGSSAAAIGDINGDGRSELIYGANESSNEFFSPGCFLVRSGMDGSILYSQGPSQDVQEGYDVCGLGDVNNDGIPDLISLETYACIATVYSGRGFQRIYSVRLREKAR